MFCLNMFLNPLVFQTFYLHSDTSKTICQLHCCLQKLLPEMFSVTMNIAKYYKHFLGHCIPIYLKTSWQWTSSTFNCLILVKMILSQHAPMTSEHSVYVKRCGSASSLQKLSLRTRDI